MKRFLFPAAAAALVAVLAAPNACRAQATWQIGAVGDNWSVGSNWDTFLTPDPAFNRSARIGARQFTAMGDPTGWDPNPSVRVIGAISSPTVRVADADGVAGITGVVTLEAGNSLDVPATMIGPTVISTGDVLVGIDGGLGTLNVAGTLTLDNSIQTPTSGAFESGINLTGSASVTAAYGFLDRQLRLVGPSVSFATTGADENGNGLILGGGGIHTWEFGASGPSKLNVSGNLDLGGGLAIETPGYTPAVGERWAIAESATIDANDVTPSGFDFIDLTGVPGLVPGQGVRVVTGAAGTTGVLTELEVVQEPVLTVNRQTGVATLKNFNPSAATVSFDAYTVRSANGSIAAANLSGLQDGSVGPGTWYETNPQSTGIGELNATDALSLAAGQEVSLGAIFAPPTPTEFGQDNEDLSFDYGTPDGGLFNAQIVYEGMPTDTLVLNVDPTTGAAQLLNPSAFEVDIDAYVLSSTSGSLDTAAWSSLDDQGADGNAWFETPSSANQLAELLTAGSTTMDASQGNVVGIGSPLAIGAEQDLVFEFALEGETFLRTGKVVYGDLVSPVDLPGDYNGDNVVDAADYTVWRDALGSTMVLPNDPTPGTVTEADRAVWAGNFGASLPGSSSAVPEPAAAVSALLLTAMGAVRRRS